MAFADKRTWDRIRPAEIKKTGIGAASDRWEDACKPAGVVAGDKDRESAAFAAVIAMQTALKNARGQLKKVKSNTKKAAVQVLLDEWQAECDEYDGKLKAAVLKSFSKGVLDKKQAIIDRFRDVFETVSEQLAGVAMRLSKTEDAIKAKDFEAANDQLSFAKSGLNLQLEFLSDPTARLKRAIAAEGKLPPGTATVTFDDVRDIWKAQKDRWDEMAEWHGRLEPQVKALDDVGLPPNLLSIRKEYKDALKAYQEAKGDVFDHGRQIMALFEETKKLTTANLPPNQFSDQARDLRARIGAVEEANVKLVTGLGERKYQLNAKKKLDGKFMKPMNDLHKQYEDVMIKLTQTAERCRKALPVQ
jgi:hypothetical protein